ncbi:MAG TPA: PDZ domain-containing protein [Bacteroidota bacterium]|nr:PDZ domain-containing protein [Bacteroidota bacterium]
MKKFFLLLFATATALAQTPTIHYKLGMSQPWTHLFEVEVSYSGLPRSGETFDLLLPVWRSGRYVVFDFAGDVQEFSAQDGKGSPLGWEKTDKMTWRIRKGSSTTVTATYKVYANEVNQRTKEMNDQGAFLDGSAVFMYADKYRGLPLTLTVTPYRDWHVTTGLENAKGTKNTLTSPTYDYLIDCPLFVGNQLDVEFEAGGKPHVLSVLGEGNYDTKIMVKDITKLVEANKELWGSLPYQRYVFMLHVSPRHGGGTEHINSTAMGTRPWGFTNTNSYNGFLGLVSHEYFHTWNVKQIRPKGISPYDWTKENYTKELWVSEGTTSYYTSRMMMRAGLSTPARYVDQLPGQIQGDRQKPGNKLQSATESSFDAWIKYWKQNEQAFNAETDYYDRGSDISLFLDLEIRNRSNNKASLDNVMKAMYERFPWNGTGFTVDDFRKVCDEFAGSSLKQFFDEHVYGTKPLEWEKVLLYAGLEAKSKTEQKAWFGAFIGGEPPRIRWQVAAGSPAYIAGLDLNDEIIALNGYRVSANDFNTRIGEMKAGDVVKLTVMRSDQLREFNVTLVNNPVPGYTVTKVSDPTDLQKAIYESWVMTKWEDGK